MNEDKFAKILTAIIVGIMVLVAIFSGSGSNGGKRKYSDLTDTEKANAKWAYEAKQAIDSYGR